GRAGADYHRARALAYRSVEGLKGFFLLSFFTDGAGTEGYCSELEKLLAHHGDAVFAGTVRSTSPALQARLISYLRYVGGWGENDAQWQKFCARAPMLSKL